MRARSWRGRVVAGLLLALAVAPADLAFARPAPKCPPGRFLVGGGTPLLPSGRTPAIDAVVIDGSGSIAVASGCAPARARAVQTKKGTKLSAKWPAGACAGITGKAKLRAKIDPACGVLTGTLSAKKLKTKFTALRSACGDGIADVDGGETCDLPPNPPETAVSKLPSADTGGFPAIGEISVDANGQAVVRTEIEVAFQPSATPAQLEALVASVSGQVISSIAGVARVVVRIPDPGTLDGLDLVLAQLRAAPIVREVRRGEMPGVSVLPEFPGMTPPFDIVQDLKFLEHHLAVGAGAAWNARAALPPRSQRPFVVVADFFGNGPPDRAFDVSERDQDFQVNAFEAHGYHVLGIIAATFDGFTDPGAFRGRNLATGIYPSTVPLRVVDGQPGHRVENQILIQVIDQIATSPLPTIVNTSIGFLCTSPALAAVNCQNPDHYRAEARAWIEKVRGTNGGRNLESAFLHVTSAGNIDTPGDTDGRTDSEFTAAALLPESELGVPPLTNVLVVENRTKFTAQRPFRPDCLSSTSKRGGNISAIGDQVFSLTDARESATRVTAGFRSGTSMAAPQVAGLAAYLLSLRRTLSVAELKSLLLATTRPVPGCDGAPVIDAYAAVLAADHGTERTVRRALLDVTNTNGDPQGDGVFDVHDLGVILGELESAPGDIDYSRYDLNGDGRTGGTERARVDLDVDDPPAYTPITRTLASLGPVEFDENAVTDLQVLCFYAYSSLYTGSTQDRDALLGTQCAPCPAGQQLGRAIDQCQSTTTTSPAGSTTTVTATTDVPPTTTICMCPPGFQCCAGTFCCF